MVTKYTKISDDKLEAEVTRVLTYNKDELLQEKAMRQVRIDEIDVLLAEFEK